MPTITTLDDALQHLLIHYGNNYEIRHNLTVGGQEVRALAEFHLREQKAFMGFKMSAMKTQISEASEYVLFLLEDNVTEESAEQYIALLETAEKELLQMGKEHGYSFFSLVALTHSVDKAAATKIKRHRIHRTYDKGWGMFRMVVADPIHRTMTCNKDGKELGALVLKHLKTEITEITETEER